MEVGKKHMNFGSRIRYGKTVSSLTVFSIRSEKLKERLEDVIVVEGVHDVQKIQSIYDVDMFYTNGSAVSKALIQKLQILSETRSIIVFTDPDYPGKKIRQTLMDAIPTIKHAFVDREKALGKGKVGVEHATVEDIKKALESVITPNLENVSKIEWIDLIQRDLVVGTTAKMKRNYIVQKLHLGHVNTKQFFKHLQLFGVTHIQLDTIIEEFENEKSRNME